MQRPIAAEQTPSQEEFKSTILRAVNREADYTGTLKADTEPPVEVGDVIRRLAAHGDL
jgi:hypothetical protein